MNLKKIIAVVAVATATLAFVGITKSNEVSAASSKQVTVWAWDDTYNVLAVKEAAKIYGGSNVNVVSMSQDDIVQKLNTALASGSTKGLPNVVLIEDYRIQGYLKSYPKSFVDLSKVVDKSKFAPYKFAVNTVNKKIYGVPFDSGVTGWFYRTDLLKQAGYSADDMKNINWDQFIQVAKDVKNKTGKALISEDPSDLGLVRTIMQEAGSWYTGKDGKTVTIQKNKALKYALSLYAEMIKQGLADQVSGWTAGQQAVQNGDAASAVIGSWYSSTITASANQSGKWAVAPIPALPKSLGGKSGKVYASNSGGAGWYVIKSGNTTEDNNAKTFLSKTFATNKDLMATLGTKIGLISTLTSAQKTDVYKAGNDFYGGQATLEDFAKWESSIPSVNFGDQTYAIESTMTGALQDVLNGKNIDSVLKDYQKQVEAQVANAQ
ncbi:MAG TPA: ABC transporter substrate-binding protein [Lactovum miscens]|uniref:ABC transporter substrate-binding protein n=1 Tax=Lactovum miscens TaxID=190387 RepID=UPI002EDAEF57